MKFNDNKENLTEKFDILTNFYPITSKKNEFCEFIDFLNNKIIVIVEIGTADLRIICFFSQLFVQKTMIAIDLEIRNRLSLSAINSNQDKRIYIEGNVEQTNQQLASALNKQIDLILSMVMSYEGVKKGFRFV